MARLHLPYKYIVCSTKYSGDGSENEGDNATCESDVVRRAEARLQ